jgi:hypothetical protein
MRRVVHELRLSERVFRDYAQQHEDKAEAATRRERDDRLWKAKRNRERADCCKAALDQYAAAIAAMPSIPQESYAEVTEEMLVAGRVAYFHFRHIVEGDVLFCDLTSEEQEDLVGRIYTAMTSARDREQPK